MKRKVWRTPKAGSLDRLRLTEETLGELADDHIRIAVTAVGLNFADLFALTGLYSATPEGSFVPGLEFCGRIIAVGSSVTDRHVGRQVMGAIRFGAYATILDADPRCTTLLPDGWDDAQGAAYLVQTFTAYYALFELGGLKTDQQVLVHSAAGGVGLQAMRFCKAVGAHPIGTVGRPEKVAFLAEQGFDLVITRTGPFDRQLAEILAGRPLHLVLDAIGGKIQKQSFEALAPMGRLVTFGAAQYAPGSKRPHYLKALVQYLTRPKYDALKMVSENRSVMGFNLIWLWRELSLFEQMLRAMDAYRLPPPHVGHRFPFERAPDALELLRTGSTVGKVVLEIE